VLLLRGDAFLCCKGGGAQSRRVDSLSTKTNKNRKRISQISQHWLIYKIKTTRRTQFVDITGEVQSALNSNPNQNRHLPSLRPSHPPASNCTIKTEHADPDVGQRREAASTRLIRTPPARTSTAKALRIPTSNPFRCRQQPQNVFIAEKKKTSPRAAGKASSSREFDGPRTRQLDLKK